MDSDHEQQAWEGVARWVRGLPWSPHGRVSRDPAPWCPMISDHERQGLRGCRAPGRSRMVSTMGRDECHAVRVRGEWQGLEERVSRAWVRGLPTSPIMSAMGPGRCRAIRVRGELQALGGRSRVWVRGLPRSPIMSAMGLAGVTRSGFVVFRDLRS